MNRPDTPTGARPAPAANAAPPVPQTIGALFTRAIATDPTRPQLTYYDDATDERIELSGATLANWMAKTANLIVDDCGLDVGQTASVGLPPHWQTAAVLLACWTAGLTVAIRDPAAPPPPADVAFVYAPDATGDWPATDRYALNLHPLALPMRIVPEAYLDFNAEVRGHGDHFHPAPVGTGAAALLRPEGTRSPDGTWIPEGTWSHAVVIAEATARGTRLGIAGGRVLIDADAHPDPLDYLLTPLSVGASIVLCRNVDPARDSARTAAERVTRHFR